MVKRKLEEMRMSDLEILLKKFKEVGPISKHTKLYIKVIDDITKAIHDKLDENFINLYNEYFDNEDKDNQSTNS